MTTQPHPDWFPVGPDPAPLSPPPSPWAPESSELPPELEPELLPDEPTGNLDSATSVQIHDLLFAINRQRGTTIVVVTHNPALAASMPRVVTLRDGRVEKDERRP